MIRQLEDTSAPQALNIILDWFEELRQLVPTNLPASPLHYRTVEEGEGVCASLLACGLHWSRVR